MATIVGSSVRPLGDRVLVRPEPREERTKGGIVLPDTAKEKPQFGKVLAVGSGRLLEDGQRVPLEVKEGDTVLFAKYGGTEIKLDDADLLLISDRDILGIVEG